MPQIRLFSSRSVWVGLLCAGLVGACAQVPANPGALSCPPPASQVSTEVRLLVSFHQAVDGASAELLQRLQRQGGACVSYRASVSPTVHAYAFVGVGDGARLRQNLLSWPLVRDVVLDQKVPPAGVR